MDYYSGRSAEKPIVNLIGSSIVGYSAEKPVLSPNYNDFGRIKP